MNYQNSSFHVHCSGYARVDSYHKISCSLASCVNSFFQIARPTENRKVERRAGLSGVGRMMRILSCSICTAYRGFVGIIHLNKKLKFKNAFGRGGRAIIEEENASSRSNTVLVSSEVKHHFLLSRYFSKHLLPYRCYHSLELFLRTIRQTLTFLAYPAYYPLRSILIGL